MFGDWAEESLLQTERALHVLGVPRPGWLDQTYYTIFVEGKAGEMRAHHGH